MKYHSVHISGGRSILIVYLCKSRNTSVKILCYKNKKASKCTLNTKSKFLLIKMGHF